MALLYDGLIQYYIILQERYIAIGRVSYETRGCWNRGREKILFILAEYRVNNVETDVNQFIILRLIVFLIVLIILHDTSNFLHFKCNCTIILENFVFKDIFNISCIPTYYIFIIIEHLNL